jgi:type VI secretion system secreted protein Hcp
MKFGFLIIGIFAFVMLSSSILYADGAAFMKLGDIKGEATDADHKDWIHIDSVQFGVGRAISSGGGSSDRESSLPSLSEITVSKQMDIASVDLFREALVGREIPGDIELTQTGSDKPFTYYKVKLTNVLVSSYSLSSGGDRPSESLSLNFSKIEVTYIPIDDKGAPGTPIKAGYDLATGKQV